MKSILLLSSIIVISFSVAFAQAPNWQWAKQSNGDWNDYPESITTDASGNIFMIGYFNSSAITFGAFTLINAGGPTFYIVKYDANGNVLWAKRSIGQINYDPQVAVDPAGNVYVCGAFTSDTIMFDSITLTKSTSIWNYTELFLVKYNSSGDVVWAKSAVGDEEDVATTLAVDSMGSIYVAGGFSSDSIAFDTITLVNNFLTMSQEYDMFLAKYDSSGNVLWVHSAESFYNDLVQSISADNFGNLYVLGYYESTIVFGNYTLPSADGDRFLVKYDTSGNVIWAKSVDVGNNGGAWSLKNDLAGNIYFAGEFMEDSITLGQVTLMNSTTNDQYWDVYLVKLDSSGQVIWAKSTGGFESDWTSCVAIDGSGNAFLTGYFQSHAINFATNNLLNSDQTLFTADMFFLKYDSAGNEIWGKTVGGAYHDEGTTVTIDRSGAVYFAGVFFSDSVQFSSTTLLNSPVGAATVFLAKLDTALSTAISENSFSDKQVNIFPNPCSGSTTISVSISRSQKVALNIFDVNGRLIASLANKNFEAGEYELVWNAQEKNSGVYFLQIQAEDYSKTLKLIVTD